jgi:hypothetical protein
MKSAFLIILTLFSLHVFSQDQPKQDKKNSNCMKFSSFSLSIQPLFSSNNSTDFSDLQRIMPKDDPLFNPSLTGYSQSYQNSPLFNFNMKLGLSSKPNRELLVGISYISGNRNATDFYKDKVKHIDTLLVEEYTFYVDSNYFSSYSFAEHTKEVGFDVSYLFRSDQSRRFSVFAGIGLYAGFTIYSDVSVSYTHDSIRSIYTNQPIDQYSSYYYGNGWNYYNNLIEKSVKTDPSILFRGYIPIGINWNLSKKNEFWKHINFVFQGSFGLDYRYITNDKGYLNPYLGLTMLGLRYTF